MPHFFLLASVLVSGVIISPSIIQDVLASSSSKALSVTTREGTPYIIDGSVQHPGPHPYPLSSDTEREERLQTPRPGNLYIAQDHDIRVISNMGGDPNKAPEENRSRRPSGMMSLLKSLSLSKGPTEEEPQTSPSSPANALVEASLPGVEHDYGHHGGHGHHRGWHGDHKSHTIHHKHTHDIKEGWGKGHKDHFSLLDFVLLGLSLLSLGGFLLNLLMNLLQLGGFFTTQTIPTVITVTEPATATSTATATGTGGGGTGTATATATGGGITGTAGGGVTGGGGITVGGGGGITLGGRVPGASGVANVPLSGTGLFTSLGSAIGKRFTKKRKRTRRRKKKKSANRISANLGFGGTKGGRKKRSLFDPQVDVATSLDVAARSILNSIESMTHQYECMERVACENNKHAMVVSKGLQVFMPLYSFSASYFGAKMGLHEELPSHTRAIFLGISELNCNAAFPQCNVGSGNSTFHPPQL